MGIGGLRGGKMGVDGKMQYNPGWESGSMKTLAAHGLAGGIVQDRMGGSFGAGFLAGSVGSYLGSSGNAVNTSELVTNTITDAVVGVQSQLSVGVSLLMEHRLGRLGICLMSRCIMPKNNLQQSVLPQDMP